MQSYVNGSVAKKKKGKTVVHPVIQERRREQGAIHIRIGDVLLFLACIGVMLFAVFQYINIQTEVTRTRKALSAARSEYEELKRSNDLYYERIISKVDMNEVARIAEEELGMHVAREGQIVSYSGQIDDYVKQYSDVPEGE